MLETKGIYVLIISVGKVKEIRVGSLGILTFERGLYAYVGSAQNNLERRVARHFNKNKRVFWHIDYLLNDKDVEIISVFFKEAPRNEECQLALALKDLYKPVRGFGSSGCKCSGHLFKIDCYENIEMFLRKFKLNLLERTNCTIDKFHLGES
ncbi:MAG: GIY-YIG nuclease family protein [Candidatus Bathyarchaeia archaeon]